MVRLVEPLEWDTEFFGFPIGRVALDGATQEALEAIEFEARELGLRCLYASVDPTAPGDVAYLAQGAGYRLVEPTLTWNRPNTTYTPPSTACVVRRGTAEDLTFLTEAVATVAPWSRFGADPRFGTEAALRMHGAWLERAVSCGDERMLTIAEDDSGVTGFATQVRGNPANFDLMGVTKPGTGVSQALLAAFFDWAGEAAVEAGPTAARNIAITRFLENAGFRVTRARYVFHRWFDDDRGAQQ